MNENGVYDARQLGYPKMLLLGLQHMVAMFGSTVLVPILVNGYFHGEGLSVQVTLFFAGVGTLLFHKCAKWKVPAFLGSSFAFLGGFAAVAELDVGGYAQMTYGEKLPYACGGGVVAGAMYFILRWLIKLLGTKRVLHFLPPVVTAPIVVCIGLGLAPSAFANASKNWILAAVPLILIIVFNTYGKGIWRTASVLWGVLIAYIVALIAHFLGFTNPDGTVIIETASIAQAGLFGIPEFQLAKFEMVAIVAMAPAAIPAMMEHIGDMSAISETAKRDFIKDPGLAETLKGDGLATMLSCLFGGPPNTTYGENTSVMAFSRVYDPIVMRIAAVIVIIISFNPKLANAIGAVPSPIVGGMSIILYGMIAAVGFRNIKENAVDFTMSRNLIIVAVNTVFGMGMTGGMIIPGTPITLTALAVASLLGIILNIVLPDDNYEFDNDIKSDVSALTMNPRGDD